MGNSTSSSGDNTTMEDATYKVRRANFAGSWYEGSGNKLDASLTENLSNVDPPVASGPVRGLVGPHAGYSYSGPTAAYAYQHLTLALQNQPEVDTILVLHPSHHVYLDGCALSGADQIETPLGTLQVASDLRNELWATKKFSMMDQETDENEHSGELHYPYIAKCCNDANKTGLVQVLPIMVGSINVDKEREFGSILKDIVARPNIVTIVSTDFCHWGSRFRYQPTSEGNKPIFEYISELDHVGMNHIEMQEPGAFARYIRETKNTICGRHPLAVWLNAIRQNKEAAMEVLNVKFVRYAQSSEVRAKHESSVSYASAVATKA